MRSVSPPGRAARGTDLFRGLGCPGADLAARPAGWRAPRSCFSGSRECVSPTCQAASGGGHTGGNTLPPWYLSGLSEALKPRGGRLSKICSFLPVKVMSYVMLPCTLPLESAVAVVQR